MEQEVSLIQMLDARERRVWHQQELLGAYGKPLVCFTMNIAGPVKDSPLIRRGFARGRQLLERQFLRCGIKPLKIDLSKAVTGPEAFYVLDAEPLTIKKLTTLVEDASPLGRLFDMDVLRPDGKKVDREELHLEGRKCLICGGPAKVCSSRRVHPVAELLARTPYPDEAALRALDDRFIAANLSPGGSADLLALCYLLHFFKTEVLEDV